MSIDNNEEPALYPTLSKDGVQAYRISLEVRSCKGATCFVNTHLSWSWTRMCVSGPREGHCWHPLVHNFVFLVWSEFEISHQRGGMVGSMRLHRLAEAADVSDSTGPLPL